jgi:molybdopterin-guanine dinucleotide biosynthesis protein A
MAIDAVVLAGGIERGEIAAHTGIAHRPLLEVGGRPMIQSELAALRGAASIGRVVLVAPAAVQAAAEEAAVDVRVTATESFLGNVVAGVAALGRSGGSGLAPSLDPRGQAPGSDHVLLLTGDLPLLTAEALNDLVDQSLAARADACYAIIPKESCERRFPGGRRTYVRLREGTFTGGNGVVVTRAFVESRQELIGRLYAARKNPVKLAAMFGFGFIFGLITGRLSLRQLEARAGKMVGAKVAAVISTYPELGFDVDKLADLELARRVAGGQ